MTITHPWMTITHEWPVTISLLPRPGCDRCLVTVIRSAQMSALPRVHLMTQWWRGRLSQARCPVKPNNFMIHNYQPSIASPSLQSQLLLHLMGMVITLSSHCITHTNGLEFCPIINLICQMIVKTRITFNGMDRRDARWTKNNWITNKTNLSISMYLMGRYCLWSLLV